MCIRDRSRIGTAGTFLIGSAGDVRLPYFIVFRGIGQTDDRRGNADAVVSPACAAWPLLQEGRSGMAAVAEKERVPPPKGRSVRTVRVRVRSGTAFRRHTAAPCRGATFGGVRAAPVGTARVLPNDGADVIAAYKKRSDATASDRFRIGSGIINIPSTSKRRKRASRRLPGEVPASRR